MPSSRNVSGLVVGAIGLSILIYYFWRRKSKREYTREELFKDYGVSLNSTSSYRSEVLPPSRTAVAVGRSDVSGTSVSSRNSINRGKTNSDYQDGSDCLNYGRLGLKSLDDVINNLESCLFKLSKYETENFDVVDAIPQNDSTLLFDDLRELLENAHIIRNKYKQKLIFTEQSYVGSDDESSNDSFVSAMEYHIDDNIEDIIEESKREKRYLYEAALRELENGNIFYRSKRTDLVKCQSDTEFIAKLHCLRMGFHAIVENESWIKEIEDFGLKLCSKILTLLDNEIEGFQKAYGRLLKFLHSPGALENIRLELEDKGVEVITLYDVLFDFLLFDALEVLENPPSSITAAVGSRWLSMGFKKKALEGSVWTILMAKRKLLSNASGFKAHLYDVFELAGGPFAWAFLGPDENARAVGTVVKDQLMFLCSKIYSDSIRWTNEDELAEDVMGAVRECGTTVFRELELLDNAALDVSE